MALPSSVQVREYRPTDEAFVYATWLRSYANNSEYAALMSPPVFFKWHHAAIDAYMARPGRLILIACSVSDPDQILGWAALEEHLTYGSMLHFVYVKPAFRQLGIATALLPPPPTSMAVTHLTARGQQLRPEAWVYVPQLFGAPL